MTERGSGRARGARASRTASERATTEPIPVQRPDPAPPVEDADATQPIEPLIREGTGSPRRGFRAGRSRAGSEPDAPSSADSSPPDSSEASAPSGSGGAGSAWTDVRAARRALARARAARKRYERQEVRRFTERSRRRRRAWLIGAGSVLLVSVGLLAIAYSPVMALREVRIEGAARIPVAEIQAAFAEDLGTPLPLITSAEVQSALEAFPLIETYSTETLPPGTLVVRIVERVPVGVLETPAGLELVDAAGVVIERPAERPEGQPVISAGPVTSEGFRAAAAVIRSLPADVRAQVVHASAETADDVRLVLAGDAAVVWGSAEESTLKATVLAQLMRSAPPGTVTTYDVSAPMSPGLIG
ncbi:FtsQ-type POTRA domain-containing protein [Agromyces silvae]|uniref:FtsQ-type POTRA domain-containing protein n=1 Tax=Agromyces silvae TaxID=3388266 RepID=UPI00280B5B59|nr:FtsQ-type POTRA domain-containing protein [Agromyces protaetiae]